MQLLYEDIPQESGSYQCRAAHISANGYASGYRYEDEYGYGSQVCIYMGLRPSRDQVNQQVLEASKVTLDVEILKC